MPELRDPQTIAIEQLLDELTTKMERLRTLYEQYFLGIEKAQPIIVRKEVTRLMAQLQQIGTKRTAIRFRVHTMFQKWTTYTTYWNRVLRQIDAGTYAPHVEKARKLMASKEAEQKPNKASIPELPPVKPAQPLFPPPPRARKASSPRTPPAPAGGTPPPLPLPRAQLSMNEAELKTLHRKFNDARAQVGETNSIDYTALRRSIDQQLVRVAEKGIQKVRFELVVSNGKPTLRAIPHK